MRFLQLCAGLILACTSGLALAAGTAPIDLRVDISDTTHKIFHAEMNIPVQAGPLILHYPKWIPGEHGPTGPIGNLTGVKFSVAGKDLAWRRDLVDMYAFHLTVPAGAETLHVALDFLSPTGAGDFTAGVSVTPVLAVFNWNQAVLYPDGYTANEIVYRPSITLPPGWQFATALEIDDRDDNIIEFENTTLEMLVDSPLITGRHFRKTDLTPKNGPRHTLNIVADTEPALNASDEDIQHYKNLVREAYAMFQARHYAHYDFLYTLSDYTAHFGLEHHQSSDNRTGADTFLDPNNRMLAASLLPHEFVHSWNAKYRRPAGLATPNFHQPMEGNLLWVYEGLTTYLGEVLTARSGLYTPEQFRAELALIAAGMDHRPGRTWRPLQDTTDNAQTLYTTPYAWSNWRRSVDFYPEGLLVWLDVDTKVRELSGNQRSLDDFLHAFYGPDDGKVSVKPYTFDELVAALKSVQAFDWADFLRTRLDRKTPGAPLAGITRGGWKLVYTDEPSGMSEARETVYGGLNLMYAAGLTVDDDGVLGDVLWNGPAFKAGLAPGMTLVAVNGRAFTTGVLKQAIRDAADSREPIELIISNEDYFRVIKLDYHGGLRYPHLVRVADAPDYLGDIIAAHAK